MLLRARVLRRVPVLTPPTTRPPTTLQIPLHSLNPRPVPPHNIPNIADPIKVLLQLVNLPQNLVEPRNLRVRGLDQPVRAPKLRLGEDGALPAQVLDAPLHLPHQAVEVPRELCQGRAVEEEDALARGATRGAGGAGAVGGVVEGRLALAEELDFFGGEAELRVGDALRWGGHRGLRGVVAARDWGGGGGPRAPVGG